jgi:hypothetical protein
VCWLFENDPSCANQLFRYCSLISKSAVLACGLLIVMVFTNRFPIIHIPEQAHVALMGDDVVHDCCPGEPSHLPALYAEWIQFEEPFPRSPPPRAVTPRIRRAASILFCVAILRLVLLAPAAAPSYESRTTWVVAGMLGRKRAHAAFRLSEMGGFSSSLAAGSGLELTADLPSSSTYPGRRFSSR